MSRSAARLADRGQPAHQRRQYTDPHGHIRLLAALDANDVVVEGETTTASASRPGRSPAGVRHVPRSCAVALIAPSSLGIGLALTEGLVELHGGSIAMRSKGDSLGNVFTVAAAARHARQGLSGDDDGLEPR